MRTLKLLALALAAAAAGCTSGAGGTPAVSDPTPGDPNLATVTFSAAFPAPPADPSLIHTATTSIVVSWQPELGTTASPNGGTRTLTYANPTASVKLPAGRYYFGADARDASGVLERAGTAGKVIAGENAVAIYFLNGKWLFKDAGGTVDQPVELVTSTADGKSPLRLGGLYLKQRWFQLGPSAVDPTTPLELNEYDATWITNDSTDPNKSSSVNVTTQFGGGAWNASILDGGDYNETRLCGTSCSHGPGNPGERSFRIAGDFGQSRRNDGAWGLLPERFVPDVLGYSSAIVNGTTLKGTIFEWKSVAAGAPVVLENLTPPAPYAPTAPAPLTGRTFVPGLVVHVPQPVVICRQGFNGNNSATLTTGAWNFGTCGAYDGTGKLLYATGCASLPAGGSPGQCNWGLVPADPGDRGEWCDNWTGTTCLQTGGNGIVEPWEFYDMNGDGRIDTGSFYFTHGLDQTMTLDVWLYPFTAKGTLVPQDMSIVIQ